MSIIAIPPTEERYRKASEFDAASDGAITQNFTKYFFQTESQAVS